jgi:hypothetical protein
VSFCGLVFLCGCVASSTERGKSYLGELKYGNCSVESFVLLFPLTVYIFLAAGDKTLISTWYPLGTSEDPSAI